MREVFENILITCLELAGLSKEDLFVQLGERYGPGPDDGPSTEEVPVKRRRPALGSNSCLEELPSALLRFAMLPIRTL